MEFGEKLQELRKEKGLTQEEVAQALFVSRTAVSKWESGRGYPSIDSIRDIAEFYSVTLDELLSGDKIISIAEKENRNNVKRICGVFMGIMDVLAFLLILLPLYPKPVDGYIYSVNLIEYTDISYFNITMYWILYSVLISLGIIKIVLSMADVEKSQKAVIIASLATGLITALFLASAKEPYASFLAIILLTVKAIIMWYCTSKKA